MRMPVETIKVQQLAWARGAGLSVDKTGYCTTLEENLFRPLSTLSRRELLAGGGGELTGTNGERCKAQALHSSASLACNFFDYWRGRDLSALAAVFGTGQLCGLSFEAKFPTGLPGEPPNVDVALYEWADGVLAIESKFTEPFRKSNTKNLLGPKYFKAADTWRRLGLGGCQALADKLRFNPATFELLDAAQLLKHMLGLASSSRHWRLCCLWYYPGGAEGDKHEAELARFVECIGPDANRFFSMTYQDAFRRLRNLVGEAHEEYQRYLADRYFGTAA